MPDALTKWWPPVSNCCIAYTQWTQHYLQLNNSFYSTFTARVLVSAPKKKNCCIVRKMVQLLYLDNTEWLSRQVIRGVGNEGENINHYFKTGESDRLVET